MQRTAPSAFAFGTLLLLAAPVLGANHGVEALPGDRFAAEVLPAGDRDAYVVPLGAGSRLAVQVRAAKGSALLPSLALRGPGGVLADLDGRVRGAGTARLQLKDLLIQDTGGWAVIVGGEGTTTGAYEVSVSAKSPSRFSRRAASVPSQDGLAVPFSAGEGSVVSFLIRRRSGPALPAVALEDPSGAEFPVPPGSVAVKGTRTIGKAIPLAGEFGTWILRIPGSVAGDANVDVTVTVKAPRPRKLHAILGPEPRPTSLAPAQGRDGTPFTVGGQDFLPGARVRFGETWAGDVAVEGGTSITGNAPDGPESTLGLQSLVVVANPDGQENAAPVSFAYLGIPDPKTASPAFQPAEGGYPLTITGLNFRPGFSVAVGGVPCPDAVLTPLGTITLTSPPHALGTASVAVTDEFGRTGTLAQGVTYIGPPVLQSAAPASSSFTGGRWITLTGTNFRPGLEVTVDGVPGTEVEGLSPTTLRFRMPAGPAGTFDVSLHDEFGRTSTAAGLVRRRGPLVNASAEVLPAAPPGTDFFGAFVTMGDLDGDLRPDLLLGSTYATYNPVTYAYMPPTVVLRNGEGGVFTDGTAALLGPFANPLDLGTASFALLGDLDGQAGPEVVLTTAYPQVSADATFQRNGKTYAYVTQGYYYAYYDFQTFGGTRILSGPAGGALADVTPSTMPAFGSTPFLGFGERWQAAAGALGDLDGDGAADLVLSAPGFLVKGSVASTTYAGGTYYLLESYQYQCSTRILRNDGTGVLAARPQDLPSITFMNGNYATRVAEEFDASAVALGDLDGDGDLDMVLTRAYAKFVYHLDTVSGNYSTYYIPATRVLRNNGAGTFSWIKAAVPAAYGTTHTGSYDYWQGTSTALGDLDRDGDLDLVLGRDQAVYWYEAATTTYRLLPAIRIFSNDGTGKFTEATGGFLDSGSFLGNSPDVILDARCVRLGDLDGDECLDLVVTGHTYYVYGYGGAPYGPYGIVPTGLRPATRVLLNDGTGRLEDLTAAWMPAAANGDFFQSDAAALGDLDGDGDVDLVLASDTNPDFPGTTEGTNRPLRILKAE
jgi:hypothetical protein